MSILQRVSQTIAKYDLLSPGDRVLLGVSGGADSLCMLHLLLRLAPELKLTLFVGHLDHQLRGCEAEQDATYVAGICRSWGVACTVERADVGALAHSQGLSIEEAARVARYTFLAALAHRLGARAIAVAHNADDQIETVLMHILRGAGLDGLVGMRPLSSLAAAALYEPSTPEPGESLRLIRPLLEVERASIEAYCREHGLQPRMDRSNADVRYLRNRVRHELIPHLEGYNPAVRSAIRRLADILSAEHEVLRRCLEDAWAQVVTAESPWEVRYDLTRFREQPLGLQRALLREGFRRLGASQRDLGLVQVDEAVNLLRDGQVGGQAMLSGTLAITLGYGEARLAPLSCGPSVAAHPRVFGEIPLRVPGTTPLPGGHWTAKAELAGRDALPEDWGDDPHRAHFDATCVERGLALRPRRPGDRFRPFGLRGSQKIHDLMIDQKIPREERATVPLLVCGDEIVWVVGYRRGAAYPVTEATDQVLVVWFEQKGR